MVTVEPMNIYLGAMILGLFTGIGLALGTVIVKIWIEPRITKWQELHKKISEQITKKPDLKDSVLFKKLVVQDKPKRGRPKKTKD
jgi:hypothetical protein